MAIQVTCCQVGKSTSVHTKWHSIRFFPIYKAEYILIIGNHNIHTVEAQTVQQIGNFRTSSTRASRPPINSLNRILDTR